MNEDSQKRLEEIETLMATPDFWLDKDSAQKLVREYQDIKEAAEGGLVGHDAGSATIGILAGAGGEDAEDFVRMLRKM